MAHDILNYPFLISSKNRSVIHCRSTKSDEKLEPLALKIDSSEVLEVDQPSTSSGIGRSPIEDDSPKVIFPKFNYVTPKAICLLLMLLTYVLYYQFFISSFSKNLLSLLYDQCYNIQQNKLKVSLSSLNSFTPNEEMK